MEELPHRFSSFEQPHVKLPRESLTIDIAGLFVVANADDVLTAAHLLGQGVGEAYVEDY